MVLYIVLKQNVLYNFKCYSSSKNTDVDCSALCTYLAKLIIFKCQQNDSKQIYCYLIIVIFGHNKSLQLTSKWPNSTACKFYAQIFQGL